MLANSFRTRVATRRRRPGVILLVVLGMLTLFSVLGISYLVYTSNQRASSVAINRAERSLPDHQPWVDEALRRLLVGSDGPESSLWGHDLLGDLYGSRDVIRGQLTRSDQFVVPDNLVAPEVLLGEFVRVPTELYRAAQYPNRRVDVAPERIYPDTAAPTFKTDDELAGRILTFTDGPLAGLSMKIVRYFGDHIGATNGRNVLTGQLVLDLRPHLDRGVTVDLPNGPETHSIKTWLTKHVDGTFNVSLLFYDKLPTTAAAPPALPLSEFYVNGRILSGPGLGWDVTRDTTLAATGTEMNHNEKINTDFRPQNPATAMNPPVGISDFAGGGSNVPASLQGHYATYRRQPNPTPGLPEAYLKDLPPGDANEPYDAPDDQNWWLSYFPINDPGYGGALPQLGTHGIPSFVRPGTLNWLINQEGGALDSASPARLQQILLAIRRATLRPLAILNDPWMPADIQNRADGVLKLDYSRFSGSNASPLGAPINFNTVSAADIRNLVRALAGQDTDGDGRPDWDVDNNGDGIPDGIWVDAGVPLSEDENGRLIKPLVSYLVEDLGGRVNVNLAGNLAQARDVIQKSASGALYGASPPSLILAASPITDLPTGFGYGPAEIDIRPIFRFSPTAVGNGALTLLSRRMNQYTVSGVDYIGAGHLIDPVTLDGNDLMGVLRQPGLDNLHDPATPQGLPVDKFGRASLTLGIDGGLMVSGASVAVANAGSAAGDAADDPYEMDLPSGRHPDHPFTLTDLEGVLRFTDFDRDALDSELVAIAQAHFNGAIAVVNPARQAFADSVTTISNSVADNIGILPQEFRDTVASGAESREARSPQSLVTRYFPGISLTADQRNAVLMQLLPQSILSGGKLNLNRPFGNGIDDDNDGVVDDPQELRTNIQVLYDDFTGTRVNTFFSTSDGDVTNGVPGPLTAPPLQLPLPVTPPPFVPRPEWTTPQSLFARHLYVLAMSLLRDTQTPAFFDFTGGAPPIVIDPSNQTVKGDGVTINSEAEEYRAWRLAQWAINVADYRDPDGIMSRFDYDVEPFDGWDIRSFATQTTFRTVWGMEYPELALEESLAFHDRRVRDTNLDDNLAGPQLRYSGGMVRDPHPDQWRLPQGSLFLELRNTRSPDYLRTPATEADDESQSWGVPRELYSIVNVSGVDEYVLDLGRVAPDGNPVWRVAITKAHPAGTTMPDIQISGDEILQPVGSDRSRPFNPATMNRLTATLQPERPNFFGPTILNPIDRVIWFTNTDPDPDGNLIVDFAPTDSNNVAQVFYNRIPLTSYPLANVYLRGGQYAVIGPRSITPVGSLEEYYDGTSPQTVHDSNTSEPLLSYGQYESPQRFELTAQRLSHFSFTNTPTNPTEAPAANATIRSVVGIIAGAKPPLGWNGPYLVGNPVTGSEQAIGLSISEPLPIAGEYYNNPSAALVSLKPGFPRDSWYDYTNPGTPTLPDVPFDDPNNPDTVSELGTFFGPDGQRTGTRERFKTAYLQRLADPTQPYDRDLNPYLSIDYITIDLTVFNGSDDNRREFPTTGSGEWLDPSDEDPFDATVVSIREAFGSRYKTGRTIFQDKSNPLLSNENLSHSANTFPPQQTQVLTLGNSRLGGHDPYFPISLSLQSIVDPDDGGAVDAIADRTLHSSSLGYANASYGPRWNVGPTPSAGSERYAGTPTVNWFSSIGWLNRPFVSKAELMWVPTTSAGTFGANFGTTTVDTGFTVGTNLYQGAAPPSQVGPRFIYNLAFPHLWNFFSQHEDHTQSPNIHRLLDWVDVPAPFDFEVDFVSTNPDLININAATVAAPGASQWGASLNYPTFGTPATSHPDSWTALPAPENEFWLNRWTIEALRPPFNFRQPQYRQGRINLNTIKSPRVYRALMEGITDSGDPVEGAFFDQFIVSRRGYTTGTPGPEGLSPNFNQAQASQMAGAFRPATVSDIASLPNSRGTNPLDKTIMRPGGVIGSYANEPLFSRPVVAGVLSEFSERSAVHQQLPITRLSNLATDQSNVFAVWITVGLFEVDESTLTVGNEVGADMGRSKRYRSFHIIDRSIPVMYQPGKMNNADETVLLSRPLN